MSLMDHSFWEVFLASFLPSVWQSIAEALPATLIMVLISSLIMLVLGMIIGVVLTVTRPDGIVPISPLYSVLSAIVNCLRSLPSVIMIILMIPVARLMFGRAYGTEPFIIAISACVIPMYARLVESSLLEISKGKLEAAESIGCTNCQIIFKILLPETLPSLIRNFTIATIAVVSMTALAGMFGGGGIGDLAVTYGYQRYQHDLLFATIYVLILLVQVIQGVGNLISKMILKKRKLL